MDGQTDVNRHVTTKMSQMDREPNFLSCGAQMSTHQGYSKQVTVEPSYNEDPVLMKNNEKPDRITVKYVETNPPITKSPQQQIDFDGLNAQFTLL